ncbi:hypothetical protein CYMTET_11443 [Cymbomonas tetramitiformis]|uniref:SGNH hydrolase-type esterase domain-containing protein n=1 Tax=Cymbomonas tetramitiformis TaxID=36881 RepID=A0AAE0GMA0_9CHLO|nr:hypothetical protein CYMTET_11443 [Cymbomonas tetramitiformis]
MRRAVTDVLFCAFTVISTAGICQASIVSTGAQLWSLSDWPATLGKRPTGAWQSHLPATLHLLALQNRGDFLLLGPFLERLQTGQAVHVAALGASITFGHGAAKPFQKNSWAYQAFTSINASFPNAGHRFTNAARPATSPSFAALCVDALVPPGVHLVMIEYSPNGSGHRGPQHRAVRDMEQVLRKLMQRRQPPAILLVDWMGPYVKLPCDLSAGSPGSQYAVEGEEPIAGCGNARSREEAWSQPAVRFWNNAGDAFNVLAQFYGLPSVSARNAFHHGFRHKASNFTLAKLTQDGLHPSTLGHRFLADLVVGAVLELYMMHQLPLPPVGDTSGRELEARLSELRRQEPVIAGNFARYSSCGIGEELSTRIIASDGFELAFGGKLRDKPGMLSEKPGSTLELNLSTETEDPQSFARFEPGNVPAPGSAKIPERRSLVMLGFLAGPSMGRARVECTRGCKCAPQEFHFQLAGDNSVVKLFDLPGVSRAPDCQIQISTLGSRNHVHPLVGGESRKKHRVKLMAVMVSDATSRSDLGQLCDGCAIPLDDANPDGYISDMDEWPRLS